MKKQKIKSMKKKLQVLREKYGLTIPELATICSNGSDQSQSFWIFLIGAYENNEITILNKKRLEKIAQVLKSTPEEVMG